MKCLVCGYAPGEFVQIVGGKSWAEPISGLAEFIDCNHTFHTGTNCLTVQYLGGKSAYHGYTFALPITLVQSIQK